MAKRARKVVGTYLNKHKARNGQPSYIRFCAGPLRDRYPHRIFAALMLGRDLREDEDVDHANGDPWDDHPANLRIVTAVDHGKITRNGNAIPEGVTVILDGREWCKERGIALTNGKAVYRPKKREAVQ